MKKNTLEREHSRSYSRTHSWIDFTIDLRKVPYTLWLMLGEAQSKCQHIAGVPLTPDAAERLYELYLAKGVHATTSIEGNTLSEDQVKQQIEGKLKLPKSQEYMAIEVQNIIEACARVVRELSEDPSMKLTPELICQFNSLVLNGLDVEDHVRPGEFRQQSVGVGTYRAAPHEDCPHLLDRMCHWLDADFDQFNESLKFTQAVIKAILAHLYIAWIHPFGDGNGRTARLIEFLLLVQSGIPLPACHLLSNHYNKTRTRYYAELDRSSKAADGDISFISYAVLGFVDGLREQLEYIRDQQWLITWKNYVHERFRDKQTRAHTRQKHLVLDLPLTPTARKNLTHVSPRVAEQYAGRGDKTLSRDINALMAMNLLVKETAGYLPNRDTHSRIFASPV